MKTSDTKPARGPLCPDLHLPAACVSLLFTLLLTFAGCSQAAPADPAQVQTVVDLLGSCPDWTHLPPESTPQADAQRRAITRTLQQIARFPTPVIRRALVQVAGDDLSPPARRFDGTIYLLNRYLFRVPDRHPQTKVQFYGGWAGVPQRDGFVNLLWPWSRAPDGQLTLTDTCHGYFGPSYLGLREFDAFANEFGRR